MKIVYVEYFKHQQIKHTKFLENRYRRWIQNLFVSNSVLSHKFENKNWNSFGIQSMFKGKCRKSTPISVIDLTDD